MNITRNNIDDLNATITITVDKKDYATKVEETLNRYRKTANIKGFRKGQVPLSFVRKQYEKSIVFEEVNQILQKEINNYIQQEKISLLGNPLPKPQDDINWDAEQLNFEFELGLAPNVEVDLTTIKTPYYKVKVTEEEVQKYVDNFSKRYGSLKTLDEVNDQANIKAEVVELDAKGNTIEDGLNTEVILMVNEIAKSKKLIGKKVGDEVVLKVDELNEDDSRIQQLLGKTTEQLKDSKLQLNIKEVTTIEAAPVDQQLFDKVYGENTVNSEEAFRSKIQEESEKMYARETDKQFLNEAVEQLLDKTKIELPKDFLQRWLHATNEQIESEEKAAEELTKMEDGLRYQLIEAKIAENFELKVEADEIKATAEKAIREQLAMYGQNNIPEEDLQNIIQSSLTNEKEYQRMADQVFADKMLNVFKENVKTEPKEVTFDEFIALVTEKNKEK